MSYLQLDLQFFSGEKTEKATPRKRDEARKKGQVAKSADVTTAFILFAVFLFLWAGGGVLKEHILNLLTHSFNEYLLEDVTANTVSQMFLDLVYQSALILGPIMLASAVAAIFANYVQVGVMFTAEPLQMKLSKINPVQGFKRIFSVRALVELLKSLLKISFVGFVTFTVIWMNFEEMTKLSMVGIPSILSFIGSTTVKMGLFASILLIILSVLDYTYQKYDFEKSIRMSKQDIKDEYKKTEGDPLIKSKIKEKQRQMAMRRMMQEIPNADVVITNPTHYAIALKYDESKADAPYVIAKGVDYVALKIKEIAGSHDIVMVENRPLARALYAEADIGDVIPEEFFKAVAEILAYVYQLKKKV